MNQAFAEDVRKGLSADAKHIPSKYFYDEEGSRIIQKIMNLDEYYLTRSEFSILTQHKAHFLELFQEQDRPFELVELGAGDGLKTKILLKFFTENRADFRYLPVDISQGALDGLVQDLSTELPRLQVEGIQGDYFQVLGQLHTDKQARKVVLFMGANIGNFHHQDALAFVREVRNNLSSKDLLVVGFDLKKNPHIILTAYNDSEGVTREFNLNLLKRINQELGGNFDIDRYIHYPVYDPASGSAKSYIMSKDKQIVHIEALRKSFQLEAWEAIYTESSYKYTPYMINELAQQAGFRVVHNFYDVQNYFCDSVWEAV